MREMRGDNETQGAEDAPHKDVACLDEWTKDEWRRKTGHGGKERGLRASPLWVTPQ